jgi:hypothetical protein
MNATKNKRTKLASRRPPREIQEKTKERRAWLAEELAKVNATVTPEWRLEGKIVGKGSYEQISVWELTEVEGRLRYRGTCQFCGHEQVVQDGVLVLHGYKRPGDGYVFGRCPAVGLRPLNMEISHTEMWLAEAKIAFNTATELLEKATAYTRKMADELYGPSITDNFRMEAAMAKPSKPYKFKDKDAELRYVEERRVWAEQFPLPAAYDRAVKDESTANHNHWVALENLRHFEYLIEKKIFGTPLKQEVVA